jgi:putative flippase GtrA
VSSNLYIESLQHLSRRSLALLPARFPKFAAVGLSGVAVDMAILWLLRAHLGWPLTLPR